METPGGLGKSAPASLSVNRAMARRSVRARLATSSGELLNRTMPIATDSPDSGPVSGSPRHERSCPCIDASLADNKDGGVIIDLKNDVNLYCSGFPRMIMATKPRQT